MQTLAVIGTFRSGSSIVAAMLDCLGVDMGAPYFGEYFEPTDLAISLRRWWQEPKLIAAESASNRVYLLREWLESRGSRTWVGAKHPLMTLCVKDLQRAWGLGTKFIWCKRPIDQSVASLERLNWWPNPREVQQRLAQAADLNFPKNRGLIVEFDDSLQNPNFVVEQLVEFLQLTPTAEQLARAQGVVKKQIGASSRTKAFAVPVDEGSTIVATMLCHNCEELVADAVRSVIDFVDTLLVIDTGCTDRSIDIVRELAGVKLEVRQFQWQNDFAAARNFALSCAGELSATWVLTIDTDERMNFGSLTCIEALRSVLSAAPNAQAWMVESESRGYQKERLIRLPTRMFWRGRTHEALCGAARGGRPILSGVRFNEVAKTPRALQSKLERDLKILREALMIEPENGRTWYYLGQTLHGLKQIEGAISAFDRCATLRSWDELAAWSCYRSAKCLADGGRYEEAIERCAIGLAIDPQFPELAWMSAWCWLQLNQCQRAIAWAKMAISIGAVENSEGLADRIGFRDLVAWYDGPYEVLCAAYAKLGKPPKFEASTKAMAEARTQAGQAISHAGIENG